MNSESVTSNLSQAQLEALKNGGRLDTWEKDGKKYQMVIVEIPNRISNHQNKKKPKSGIEFYQLPKAVVDALIRVNYAPVWPLAAAVYKRWYDDFKKRNPVKLTSALLAEFEISKDQKSKGLKLLEETDWFIVKRFRGHNPLVTMKWILIKD
jgi:hypothetical protein